MGFSSKPSLNSVDVKNFIQDPVTETTPTPEKPVKKQKPEIVDERIPFVLRFRSAQEQQDAKLAAVKLNKTLRLYILDVLAEENKKYLS